MLPPKFGSVRYKNHPVVRRTTDPSIVSLRYEKTVQAEAPIPVTSRNSVRLTRRPSSSSASSHSSHHPVVVPRPGSVAPPTEEHPALRNSVPSPTARTPLAAVEEWKRDSGVARNNSSSTIHEEDEDECPGSRYEKTNNSVTYLAATTPLVSSSLAPSTTSPTTSYSDTKVKLIEDPFLDVNVDLPPLTLISSASSALTAASVVSNAHCTTPPASHPYSASSTTPTRASSTTKASRTTGRRAAVGVAIPASRPFESIESPQLPSSPSCSVAPTSSSPRSPSSPRSSFSSSPRKLVRSLSLRSSSRFGIKGLSQVLGAPMQPLWRSSPPGTPGVSGPSASSTLDPSGPYTGTSTPATVNATATTATTVVDTAGPKHLVPSSSPKSTSSSRFWNKSHSTSTTSINSTSSSDCHLPFLPLDVSIPCGSLVDDGFMSSFAFSKRGSIMFGTRQSAADGDAAAATTTTTTSPDHNKKPLGFLASHNPFAPRTSVNNVDRDDDDNDDGRATPTPTLTTIAPTLTPAPSTPTRATTPTTPVSQINSLTSDEHNNKNKNKNASASRTGATSPQGLMPPPGISVLAADVEKESQKVRSLYAVGDGSRGESVPRRHSYCERLEPTPEVPSEENELDPAPNRLSPAWQTPVPGSSSFPRYESPKPHLELAGGLEDWNDLDGALVDRYGFITLPPPPGSRAGTPTESRSAQGSPRKRNVLQKRDPSGLSSSSSFGGPRTPTRKVSARSLNTQTSELSLSTSLRSSRSVIRQASNLLPHNRDRRWMDEAGDMLSTTPSLQDIVDEVRAEMLTEAVKRKESERSEKWRKMAKVVRKGSEGQGMEFEFDVKNPKLIERTWKGIPDRWRAAAWWSFMATSAREHNPAASEQVVVAEFRRLQLRSSPDDVQIDLDVPRTISRHIMFRRRYRGGQRLLFRVLHAISIYFPETGYVQGMASLAATLLCYFDEEKCFVMLVRMWQLRGLARLYRPGFVELMAAMSDFNDNWLGKDVASKLAELCIDTTAYGTRWYLTLFNLSIPFPAQLRVWDVFLLLGDDPSNSIDSSSQTRKAGLTPPSSSEYDILHATSAALAQALREVLLDAEFENAMKALTSSIPIKDEDLLMKVVKAEWRLHHGKRRA